MLVARPPPVAANGPQVNPLDSMAKESGEALQESQNLFISIRDMLDAETTPSKDVLRRWKRQVRKINVAISKTTRAAWRELDRTKIEVETIKINTAHDILDERSNIARVLERIRTYSNVTEGAVDRALVSTAAVQNMMGSLANTPETGFHGASLLSQDVRCNKDSYDAQFSEAAGIGLADARD